MMKKRDIPKETVANAVKNGGLQRLVEDDERFTFSEHSELYTAVTFREHGRSRVFMVRVSEVM